MSIGPELFSILADNFTACRLPARIAKIETGETWAAFKFGRKGNWLLFSWNTKNYGCGIICDGDVYLLKNSRTVRSSFGEALKSNFLGATFLSVEQQNNDRVLLLKAERIVGAGFPVSIALVFEGTERNSNLIILDGEGTVLEPAKHVHGDMNRYRMILPGMRYVPPPPLKGKEWIHVAPIRSPDTLRELLGVGKGLVDAITPIWEEYPVAFWNTSFSTLLQKKHNADVPMILQKKGTYSTVFPGLLPGFTPLFGDIAERCGEEIISSLFSAQRGEKLRQVKKAVEKESKSRERHADGLRNQLAMAERSEEYKKKGNLILAEMDVIPPRAKEVSVVDWETGKQLFILLDERLSPSQNAERYFKKYKKGKVDKESLWSTIRSIEDGVAELQEQVEYLETIDTPDLLAIAADDILEWISPKKKQDVNKKKKENAPPHIRLRYEECDVYIGLNARGNRYVTFRVAAPTDLWFHVHDIPGAHVILKSAGRDMRPSATVIEVAASFAAWYSRGKHSTKIQVDYTEKKNVRSISGNAIAHVTYTHPRTIQVRPDLWKELPGVVRSRLLEAKR